MSSSPGDAFDEPNSSSLDLEWLEIQSSVITVAVLLGTGCYFHFIGESCLPYFFFLSSIHERHQKKIASQQ